MKATAADNGGSYAFETSTRKPGLKTGARIKPTANNFGFCESVDPEGMRAASGPAPNTTRYFAHLRNGATKKGA